LVNIMVDDDRPDLPFHDQNDLAALYAKDDAERAETQRLLKKLERPAEPRPARLSDSMLVRQATDIALAHLDGLAEEIASVTGSLEKQIRTQQTEISWLRDELAALRADRGDNTEVIELRARLNVVENLLRGAVINLPKSSGSGRNDAA
jgi:hypothetical protein